MDEELIRTLVAEMQGLREALASRGAKDVDSEGDVGEDAPAEEPAAEAKESTGVGEVDIQKMVDAVVSKQVKAAVTNALKPKGVGAAAKPTEAGPVVRSRADFQALKAKDPQRAQALILSGQVDLRTLK